MPSYRRIIRAYAGRKGVDRIQAMRDEAAKDPGGIAHGILPIVLWEEGEIAEANQLAERFLEESPDDFNLLIICLDFQIRADNFAGTFAYAQRVTAVRKPSTLRRVMSVLLRPRLWRARIFGRGQVVSTPEEILDDWARAARDYVDLNAPRMAALKNSLERAPGE